MFQDQLLLSYYVNPAPPTHTQGHTNTHTDTQTETQISTLQLCFAKTQLQLQLKLGGPNSQRSASNDILIESYSKDN